MITRIMLDLETLGTAPGSGILAIGAVKFGGGRILGEFYERVSLINCVAAGLTMDPATVLWWFRQSDQARAEFDKPSKSLSHALEAFNHWIVWQPDEAPSNDDLELWGNGASFDNVLLAEAHRAIYGSEPSWAHRKSMCYRTVKNLYPDVQMVRDGTHHNALDDARSQAMHLMAMLPTL